LHGAFHLFDGRLYQGDERWRQLLKSGDEPIDIIICEIGQQRKLMFIMVIYPSQPKVLIRPQCFATDLS
jgi:hypothetical protein